MHGHTHACTDRYSIEISLKLYALGPKQFFVSAIDTYDLLVICIAVPAMLVSDVLLVTVLRAVRARARTHTCMHACTNAHTHARSLGRRWHDMT